MVIGASDRSYADQFPGFRQAASATDQVKPQVGYVSSYAFLHEFGKGLIIIVGHERGGRIVAQGSKQPLFREAEAQDRQIALQEWLLIRCKLNVPALDSVKNGGVEVKTDVVDLARPLANRLHILLSSCQRMSACLYDQFGVRVAPEGAGEDWRERVGVGGSSRWRHDPRDNQPCRLQRSGCPLLTNVATGLSPCSEHDGLVTGLKSKHTDGLLT